MMKNPSISYSVPRFGLSPLLVLLFAAAMLALGACGSTKVYTTDKTMTYKGSLYNLANVQRIGSRVDGQTQDGEVIALQGLDKKAVQSALKEKGPLTVSTVIELDSQDVVYERARVKSYSDYSKMSKRLDSALGKIGKFMADKKKSQLSL